MKYQIKKETLGSEFPATIYVKLELKKKQKALLDQYKCLLNERVCSYPEAGKFVKIRLKHLITNLPFERSLPKGVCVHQIERMIQENLDVLQVFFNLSQLSGGAA